MISKQNFEKAAPLLHNSIKERGWDLHIERESWDTFIGWQGRNRSVMAGSKGISVPMIVPYGVDQSKVKFVMRNKVLFSINQTIPKLMLRT